MSEAGVFDKHYYHESVSRHWDEALLKLNKLITSTIFFNLTFLCVGLIEIAAFLSFFSWSMGSSFLAFTLSLFFLTLFSYLVIRLYFQTKRPEQLSDVCETYIKSCKEIIGYREGIPEHHIAIANALQKFATVLNEKEYSYYCPPPLLKSLAPIIERFSAFCHWKDLHSMKEQLLHFAISEHIKAVKCEPLNLQVHAALANAYVMLSLLYADPRKNEGYDEEKWIPQEKFSKVMQDNFLKASQRAIEEFKILNDLAPNDPWVHVQLAYSYHDLQMPEDEIKEYEIILTLNPDDQETLFKLGMLYFQQGKNADGLRIYEQLKPINFKKAESLIKFYGAFDFL